MALLNEAFRSLKTDPSKTLSLCDEHARRFPKSQFAQERETVAIGALLSLGRTADARKRGDAFRAAFPDSADNQRIDQMLSSP
jgi:hypothetical protein